jgi:hypothetical protein
VRCRHETDNLFGIRRRRRGINSSTHAADHALTFLTVHKAVNISALRQL